MSHEFAMTGFVAVFFTERQELHFRSKNLFIIPYYWLL